MSITRMHIENTITIHRLTEIFLKLDIEVAVFEFYYASIYNQIFSQRNFYFRWEVQQFRC